MSDIIQLLPDSVANQIAAGEVIQRPASVIKELVENSIDAGARTVNVLVTDAGRTSIQVIDDGQGMSETDARMAFERHATSKIRKADDLFALHTMGFRGEALASIAAVAQVELRTRTANDEIGTHLSIAGSKIVGQEPVSCPVGSNFSVENIFYNVPARRKFLKSNATELNNILTAFERIALVYPGVNFTFHSNGVETFNLKSGNLRQRIVDIFGKKLNADLLPVGVETTICSITGFVGKPESARKKGAHQYFFVNGRYMKHPYFHKAVMQAYDQLIPPGEMPSYFIYMNLDPSTIDVNIHPTKTEIKFENEQPIWQILLAATRETLAKSSAIPTLDFNSADPIDIPLYNPSKEVEQRERPTVQLNSGYNPFNPPAASAPSFGGGGEREHSSSRREFDWAQLYENFESDREKAINTEFEQTEPVEKNMFEESLMPCYQYKNHYIVTSLKSGLALIDQHRAHIRVLFEQYQHSISQKRGLSQQMLFPAIVEFTPSENACLPLLLEDLSFAGFDLSDLGGGSYSINGIPSGMEGTDCVKLLKEIVLKAIETGCKVKDEISDMIAFSLAAAQAIPIGKPMSAKEMDHLLASLFVCTDSNLTPDGKTIMTIFSNDEIDKRFGR